MAATALGLAALIFSAEPSEAKDPNVIAVVSLASMVLVLAAGAHFAAKLHGAAGSVVLGSLAGLSFGCSAIASRPLVNANSVQEFLTDPLLYIFLVHTVAGQLIMTLALQRGVTTAAAASMNAMAAAPVAVVGVLLLGDQIVDGRAPLAVIGFIVTLVAVVGMALYSQPQQHVVSDQVKARLRRNKNNSASAGAPETADQPSPTEETSQDGHTAAPVANSHAG